MAELSIVEARIERLSESLKASKLKRRKPKQPRGYTIHIAKAAYLQQRRDRLESERPIWARLIEEKRGDLKAIAGDMKVGWYTARNTLWDLGLWPALVEARRQG